MEAACAATSRFNASRVSLIDAAPVVAWLLGGLAGCGTEGQGALLCPLDTRQRVPPWTGNFRRQGEGGITVGVDGSRKSCPPLLAF